MVHQVYVGNYGFNSIINGATSMIARTFVIDPAIVADDYVIFINRENKKRTMVRVTASEKKSRMYFTAMLQNVPGDNTSLFKKMYEHYEENTRNVTHYKIEFEAPTFQIEFPVEKENYRISEITFFVVSDDGISLNKCKNIYEFCKIKVDEKDDMAQIKIAALKYFGLEDEVVIPLMKYSMGKSYNESYGQILLIQPKVMPANDSMEFFKPIVATSIDDYDKKLLAETLNFSSERDRYIFWLLGTLFLNDDIPENELGFVDEPETIADILCNRIKCLHDLIYLDYNNFNGDNFRIYVEPNLTDSQCFERATKLALTEENYQQVMDELIYNPAFAEWALNYDRERTLNDRRYINEWLL